MKPCADESYHRNVRGPVEPDIPDSVEYVSLPMSALAVGDRRLEAETYLTGGYSLRFQIVSSMATDPLEELATVWQPSRLKGTQVAPEHGIPFFTATQVFDIRPIARKWVAPSKTSDLSRRFVERDWILVTCSGSVGDATIAFKPHLESVISHDLLRMQVRDPKMRGYVYTFLRSRFGRVMMRSSKYGSIVKHLEPEHLFDLPIPRVADSIRDDLGEAVNQVFALREQAFTITREAEQIYERQFPPFGPTTGDEVTYTAQSADMFSGQRRLDAYHYNPAVQAVHALMANTPKVPLSRVTRQVFGVARFKHVYQDVGIPYLDSEDLFKLNPEIAKFIPEETKKDAAKYQVDVNWLLMACSGQLYGLNGNVVLANSWHTKKIVSNHVLRIVPRDIRPGYLAMVLGHPFLGRPLILSLAFGSEIPEIPAEALSSVPVARLGSVEDEIANRMEQASTMRMKADREEDSAVERLERNLERLLKR